jgi:hypothetical protein
MLTIFYSSRQAKQPIPHTTLTLFDDCVEMCEDFASDFGDKRTGCCVTTTTLFTRELLTKKHHDCRSPPTLLFSVSRLKIKLKGRHFDTIQVIEAESQAVLNILAEHGFQDAFKMADSPGTAHARGRELLRG